MALPERGRTRTARSPVLSLLEGLLMIQMCADEPCIRYGVRSVSLIPASMTLAPHNLKATHLLFIYFIKSASEEDKSNFQSPARWPPVGFN